MKNVLRKIKKLALLPYVTVAPVIGKACSALPRPSRLFSDTEKQIFFGYYDISPISPDGNTLLACRAPGGNVSPHGTHPELEVGYYDLKVTGSSFHSLGFTTSWNWQQGCRLQWLPDGQRVIYNIFENGRFGSRVQRVSTGQIERTLSEPVYAVSPDGARALTPNFSRLHNLRQGYGYSQLPELANPENYETADGVWLVDMLADTKSLLLSMEKIRSLNPLPDMEGATHYLNHLDFSPDGQKICFIHLWLTAQNKRRTRMIVCDVSGQNVVIPTNEGHSSHHCWRSPDELLIYSRRQETGERYHLYTLSTGAIEVIGEGILCEDGHPSFVQPGLLLSDTYPSAQRCQELFTYDIAARKKTRIAKIFSPMQFTGEVRCDLHPRIRPGERQGCIDMVHEGRRAICLFNLDQ